MKIRNRFLPRSVADIGAFTFLCIMIPITYFFELCVVLPYFYDLWSFWYVTHFIGFTLLLINVCSSAVAVLIADTSTKSEFIPPTLLPDWHFCAVCEAVAPPRSWHCNICKTCILKRDHHCIFTGCCIGHYNQRFFLMFLMYMCIGTVYATRFNSVFIWNFIDISSPLLFFKMMFPFAVLVFGIDASEKQCFLLIFLVDFVVMLFTGSLVYHHLSCLFKGCTTYEKNHKICNYDEGFKENIKKVFGERWYISWLFPFIPSELTHDGIHWETKGGKDK